MDVPAGRDHHAQARRGSNRKRRRQNLRRAIIQQTFIEILCSSGDERRTLFETVAAHLETQAPNIEKDPMSAGCSAFCSTRRRSHRPLFQGRHQPEQSVPVTAVLLDIATYGEVVGLIGLIGMAVMISAAFLELREPKDSKSPQELPVITTHSRGWL